MVKKYLMTTLWRIGQTGPFLSIFFWGTALAGIFWPILGQQNPPGPLWWFVTGVLGGHRRGLAVTDPLHQLHDVLEHV